MVPKLWAGSFSSEKELLPVFPQQGARTHPMQEQRSRGPDQRSGQCGNSRQRLAQPSCFQAQMGLGRKGGLPQGTDRRPTAPPQPEQLRNKPPCPPLNKAFTASGSKHQRAGTLCPEKLGQHAVCFVLCHSVKV